MSELPDQVTAVVTMHFGERQIGQDVSGEPGPVAAWLRAVADRLDPPRNSLRAFDPDRARGGVVRGGQVYSAGEERADA